jgi:hypothetical protein
MMFFLFQFIFLKKRWPEEVVLRTRANSHVTYAMSRRIGWMLGWCIAWSHPCPSPIESAMLRRLAWSLRKNADSMGAFLYCLQKTSPDFGYLQYGVHAEALGRHLAPRSAQRTGGQRQLCAWGTQGSRCPQRVVGGVSTLSQYCSHAGEPRWQTLFSSGCFWLQVS